MSNVNVARMVEDYRALQARQAQAPDWPYEGDAYSVSESAATERWEFWHNASRWASRREIDQAQEYLGLI